MKIYLILFVSIAFQLSSAGQSFQWAAVDQKTTATVGSFLSADNSGNIYMVGYNASRPINDSVMSIGSFISKYD
jgi:hypothetical protein